MGLIDRLTGGKKNENPAENSGGSQPSADGATPPAPDSASAAIIQGRKQRRSKQTPTGSRGEELSPSQTQMAQAFDELYRPETWEGIVCAPADTMLALSGRKLWEVSPPERKTLSTHAALTAKCFAVENPKWLALTMLAISIAHIYGARTVQHMAERRAEKEREQEEKEMGEKLAGAKRD